MTTNTTSRSGRWTGVTGVSSGAVKSEGYSHRLGSAMHSQRNRDSVVLQGRFVVSSSGQAEVVVSVDQKAFRRAMLVRDINNHVEGRTTAAMDTAISISAD